MGRQQPPEHALHVQEADAFNQDLSGWCVSNIASEPSGFDYQTDSWVLARPQYGGRVPRRGN